MLAANIERTDLLGLQINEIKAAINKATTIDEVDALMLLDSLCCHGGKHLFGGQDFLNVCVTPR